MSTKAIIGNHGNKRGIIEEDSFNNILSIWNCVGERIGYYDQSSDKTFDKYSNYVGEGDQRYSLLED